MRPMSSVWRSKVVRRVRSSHDLPEKTLTTLRKTQSHSYILTHHFPTRCGHHCDKLARITVCLQGKVQAEREWGRNRREGGGVATTRTVQSGDTTGMHRNRCPCESTCTCRRMDGERERERCAMQRLLHLAMAQVYLTCKHAANTYIHMPSVSRAVLMWDNTL